MYGTIFVFCKIALSANAKKLWHQKKSCRKNFLGVHFFLSTNLSNRPQKPPKVRFSSFGETEKAHADRHQQKEQNAVLYGACELDQKRLGKSNFLRRDPGQPDWERWSAI